jgi:hypothetical protein
VQVLKWFLAQVELMKPGPGGRRQAKPDRSGRARSILLAGVTAPARTGPYGGLLMLTAMSAVTDDPAGERTQ